MAVADSTLEQDIVAAVRERFGTAVEDVKVDRKNRVSVVASKESIVEVAA